MSSAVMASRGQWTGSLMNPVGTSRDRHMPAWGPRSVHGGLGELDESLLLPLHQSGSVRDWKRERESGGPLTG